LLPAVIAGLEQDPFLPAVVVGPKGDIEGMPAGCEPSDASFKRFQLILYNGKSAAKALKKGVPPRPRSQQADLFRPDHQEPDGVNVVVYARENLEFLGRTLLSLKSFTDLQKNSLCIIDDSQNRRLREKITEWTSDAGFCERVTYERRTGFCAALREFVNRVRWGDFCVLQEGVVLTPGWLDSLKKAAYHDRRIGVTSPVTRAHPLYSFRMNPGDTVMTCARKLSLVSGRHYPVLPLPDRNILYIKGDVIRQNPLPPPLHGSDESYLLDYASALAESDVYCVLADDTFVHVPGGRELYSSDTETLIRNLPRARRAAETIRKFCSSRIVSLENYSRSDIRLDQSKTAAVFFGGLNLGGGTLVLVELCNDLILNGWNVIGVLLNPRQHQPCLLQQNQ